MIRARRPVGLPIDRSCQILQVCRSEFYANLPKEVSVEPVTDELLEAIQAVADERPAYGYRRIGASLRKRGHRSASNKKVRTRMRQLGLNRRKKRRKARTTVPGKGPCSPNLAADLNLTGPRQLLITDITYVAIPKGFAYVSVILDAFSRRALGWAASESLATELPLEALDMVFALAALPDGWVHHSDRGCQYTSSDYKERVHKFNGLLSNSKPACPYDNAAMESFFSSLKTERTARKVYRTRAQARADVFDYIERFYNSTRRHSTLGYVSPIQFEEALKA